MVNCPWGSGPRARTWGSPAVQLLGTMLHQGLLPDVITYESLIQCFAATGHIAAGFASLAVAGTSEVL